MSKGDCGCGDPQSVQNLSDTLAMNLDHSVDDLKPAAEYQSRSDADTSVWTSPKIGCHTNRKSQATNQIESVLKVEIRVIFRRDVAVFGILQRISQKLNLFDAEPNIPQ